MKKKYNNSAKAKMIRVAADEKDKKNASAAGKKRLDYDISSMINMSGGYNNSAKAKMVRVAADEKDKKNSSAAGVKRLNKDISSMINMAGTSMGYSKMSKSGIMQCGSCIGKHMKGNSGINMSADLKYMPVIDREKDAMKKGDVGGPKMMGMRKARKAIKKQVASGDVFGSNNKCS